jgi:maltooligosyltrehalose trehalohydrolase
VTYPASVLAGQENDVTGRGWKLVRGATLNAAGTTFSVWAPKATALTVHVATGSAAGDYPLVLDAGQRGLWEMSVPAVQAGDRYGYCIDGGDPLPDPVSRSQPNGVHGLSEVVDPGAYTWTDDHWRGVALADYAIYEVHVGTFTEEGTFDAAAARLPDLLALGITAVELMPIASFPGRRNWGYDGVHLYAPQESYGGVRSLKSFVNAAHAHGIGVVLDVVYNHVGPEGNYLDQFGPYFTDVYQTPWGRAVNYDGRGSDAVRRWAHDNALYWLTEFHMDALRLDAVHGIFDFGPLSFLEELSDGVHGLGRQLGRKVQLMAESDLNDPRLVRSPELGGFGIDAQWSDDVHHTIHTTLTGESNGYYGDFRGIATMADVYREPFFYWRRYARHRDRIHGRSAAGISGKRFIVAAQNHDQVGNRPNGERLTSLVGPEKQRVAAALVLLSPYVPLLFMGEEYGETAPFLYFIEHGDPALIEAVRAGRKREFEALGSLASQIDPQAEETFVRSRLDWSKRDSDAGLRLLTLYRDLLALRREEPALKPGASETLVQGAADWLTALRVLPYSDDIYDSVGSRRAIYCVFNLSSETMNVPVHAEAVGGWKLRLFTDAAGYGGSGAVIDDLAPEAPTAHDDAPKRLLAPLAPRARSVRMPAWSAAVFERDVASEWSGR